MIATGLEDSRSRLRRTVVGDSTVGEAAPESRDLPAGDPGDNVTPLHAEAQQAPLIIESEEISAEGTFLEGADLDQSAEAAERIEQPEVEARDFVSPFAEDELDVPAFLRRKRRRNEDSDEPAFLRRSAD